MAIALVDVNNFYASCERLFRPELRGLKNSLRGSCHKLGAKHLPRHLAEYCFRFNHRFDLKSMLVELGHAVMASPPMPYRLLKLAEGHG